MPQIFGLTNPPSTSSATDGTTNPVLLGQQGDMLVSELHGKYYNQTKRGNVFFASTAATGVTISIFSNGSYTGLALWNPQGSGKNLSMIRTIWSQTTVATATAGLGYAWLVNAGSSIGTGQPLSAFSNTGVIRGSAVCGTPGQGNSVVVNAPISATLTTAMTWGRSSPVTALIGANSTVAGLTLFDDLDGTMIIPPGTFWAMTTTAASGSTAWALTAVWEEVPL